MAIRTRSVDSTSWDDVTEVFGPSGGSAGCWCTFWRLTNQEANGKTPADNQAVLEEVVRSGGQAGVLAYQDGKPVGWCSVAPRTVYKRVFRTKGLEPADPEDAGVWSVVCVYVKKESRGAGVAGNLLEAAVKHARAQGATVIEGYPIAGTNPKKKSVLSAGTIDLFTKAGFSVYREPSTGSRVIMRRKLKG
ncbi:GNAT family N-acetyltransferase [Kibdelosporangium persicum]|uniref:N-acetyltransferase n=1 Tax=Kibdelosporangium persicum TaxID=2698649 RepID=A0ABX2FHV0_9PSEU|nr:GNAT family N-acetyltransferase [Kibdelosporangium persicum]NRN70679.1 N-acetyltransferase [Kibdelosporangium persicum]